MTKTKKSCFIANSIYDSYCNKTSKDYNISSKNFEVISSEMKLKSTLNDQQKELLIEFETKQLQLEKLKTQELIEFTIDFLNKNK